MAGSVFDLFARLLLDDSEFKKGLDGARGYAQSGGSVIGGALKTGLKVAGAALAAGATAATAFSKSAIDESISFESAFTGVMKTVNQSATTTYDDLKDAIKMMSTQTASSKEAIAGVMEVGGQLGITADNLVDFSKTIIMLSDSTNLSAEEGAVALARFMNITKSAPEDVGKLGSSIVALGNNFATDEASIVSMSTRLAASGTIAGLTAPDILALATAMSSVGIEAEAGGTAMSTVLTKIGKAVDEGVSESNEKLQTFASVSGMTAEEFATAWRSNPVEALSSFIVGLNGTIESGDNVSTLLDDLGIKGIRETNMIKSLALANGVLSQAVGMSSEAYTQNAALSEEASKRYETTESKISQLKEAYKNLKITIGDELTPTVREFVDGAKERILSLIEVLQNGGLSGALEAIRGAFDRVREALSPLTERIAQFTTNEQNAAAVTNFFKGAFDLFIEALHLGAEALAFAIDKISAFVEWLNSGSAGAEAMKVAIVALIAGFMAFEGVNAVLGLVKSAFLALNAVMAANPIALVVAAVAALAAGFIYLWNTSEGFREFWINLWTQIKDFVSPIIESLKEFFAALAETVKAVIQALGEYFKAFYEEHKAQIDAFCNTVKTVITAAIDLVKGILTTAFTYIRDAVKGTIDFITGVLKVLSSLLSGDFKGAWEAAKETVSKFAENVSKTMQNLGENLGKIFTNIAKSAVSWGSNMIGSVKKGISEKVSEITNAMRSIKDSLSTIFQNLGNSALQWGRDLIGNFVNGLQEKLQSLKEKAIGIAQEIANYLGFSEPKEGPLSNFHTYAPDMMKLFAKGIKDNEHLVTDAITNAADFGGAVTAAGFSSGTVVGTGGGRSIAAGPRMQTIILQVGRTELARLVHELNGEEDERIGLKLVTT